jgi:hypothetical protein
MDMCVQKTKNDIATPTNPTQTQILLDYKG